MKARYFHAYDADQGMMEVGEGWNTDTALANCRTLNYSIGEEVRDIPDNIEEIPEVVLREMLRDISHKFSNGVVVINTTPHTLRFQTPEGNLIEIPTSVPDGQRSGWAIVNAQATTEVILDDLEKTTFRGSPEGETIVNTIVATAVAMWPNSKIRIVGSLAAANAYRLVLGMVPEVGYERVPPADKRMSCRRFNVGECW